MTLTLKTKKRLKKIIISLFIILMVSFLALLTSVPILISNQILNNHIDFENIYTAEEFNLSSEKLTLTTEDELNIFAYEVYEKSPNAVVVFLSGIQNPSVTAFFGHAHMLKENGYASILLEMRAHGESEGDVIGAGFTEVQDVQAVIDYIRANDQYTDAPIVLFGLSLGGAVAINATGQIPEIDGLISFSSYSSWEDIFCDSMKQEGAPDAYLKVQKPFVKLYTNIKYGFNRSHLTPKKQIENLDQRPALIYHSKGDSQANYRQFEMIMDNAPSHVETWVVEGDKHIPTDDLMNPVADKAYSEAILNFLDKYFHSRNEK